VLAKVSRDRLMVAMESEHPGYGFAEHKGYSTAAHSSALAELGPCSQHRYSFINVRRLVAVDGQLGIAMDTEAGPVLVPDVELDAEPEAPSRFG
jgi:ribonuclease HII